MLIISLILLLLSNSITLRRDKSILYSRVTITILLITCFISYDNLHFLFLNKGIGIFGGLFHSTCITSVFHIFILLTSSIILLLTSFYPRKV
jgi:NADH-ubiquinone oxidoreductase chain 2